MKHKLKWIGLVAAGMVFAMSLAKATNAAAATSAAGHKVTICHVDGHAGDYRIGSEDPSAALACEANIGGNAITISVNGCKNGHQPDLGVMNCSPDGADAPAPPPGEPGKPAAP